VLGGKGERETVGNAPGAAGEVAALDHEVLDDAVEPRAGPQGAARITI